MTTVKTSLIPNAGSGVFTTRDFRDDEQICFFDGYNTNGRKITPYEAKYALGSLDLVGYQFPRQPLGNGQLINDACCIQLTDDDNMRLTTGELVTRAIFAIDLILKYYEQSVAQMNVYVSRDTDTGKIWFCARRDISAGEELYYTYGPDYWLTEFKNKNAIFDTINQMVLDLTDWTSKGKYRANFTKNLEMIGGFNTQIAMLNVIREQLRSGRLIWHLDMLFTVCACDQAALLLADVMNARIVRSLKDSKAILIISPKVNGGLARKTTRRSIHV